MTDTLLRSWGGLMLDGGGAVRNVMHPKFGASGSGVVDERTAFLAMLADLPADGGDAIVPAGIYLFDADGLDVDVPVRMRLAKGAELRFRGTDPYGVRFVAGSEGSRLEGPGKITTNKTTTFDAVRLSGVSKVKVRHVEFVGNGLGTDPTTPVVAVKIDQSHGCTVSENSLADFNVGVYLLDTAMGSTNPSRNKVTYNQFKNTYGGTNTGYGVLNVRSKRTIIGYNQFGEDGGTFGRHCIYLSAGSTSCGVYGNNCEGALLGSIQLHSGTTAGEEIVECTVEGNICEGAGSYAVNAHEITGTGALWRVRISGNTAKYSAAIGILLQAESATVYPQDCQITWNIVLNPQDTGIQVDGGLRISVAGNKVRGAGQHTDQSYSGMLLLCSNLNATDCVFSNNQSNGNTGYGLNIASGAAGTSVMDNDLQNNTVEALLDAGSNTRFRFNRGFTTENSGDATITNGTTSIAVNHGCRKTPTSGNITITPQSNLGSAVKWWVSGFSSTQFTINVDANPGGDIIFGWHVSFYP